MARERERVREREGERERGIQSTDEQDKTEELSPAPTGAV